MKRTIVLKAQTVWTDQIKRRSPWVEPYQNDGNSLSRKIDAFFDV